MLPKSNYKQNAQNGINSSIQWLANMFAFISTFLGAPYFYGLTEGWVREFAVVHYNNFNTELVLFVWGAIITGTTFFGARLGIYGLLFSGAVLAFRFAL